MSGCKDFIPKNLFKKLIFCNIRFFLKNFPSLALFLIIVIWLTEAAKMFMSMKIDEKPHIVFDMENFKNLKHRNQFAIADSMNAVIAVNIELISNLRNLSKFIIS